MVLITLINTRPMAMSTTIAPKADDAKVAIHAAYFLSALNNVIVSGTMG